MVMGSSCARNQSHCTLTPGSDVLSSAALSLAQNEVLLTPPTMNSRPPMPNPPLVHVLCWLGLVVLCGGCWLPKLRLAGSQDGRLREESGTRPSNDAAVQSAPPETRVAADGGPTAWAEPSFAGGSAGSAVAGASGTSVQSTGGVAAIAGEHAAPSTMGGQCGGNASGCTACTPSSAHCDGATLVQCSPDGRNEIRTACAGATPVCKINKCVECADASSCGDSDDCTTRACDGISNLCVSGPHKPMGASCKGGGVCDGEGKCVTCGNGKLDDGEACETTGPEAYSVGTCDPTTCRLTDAAYAACSGSCPQSSYGWSCGRPGVCTKVCQPSGSAGDPCRTTTGKGQCMLFGGAFDCAIPCSDGCPSGLRCVDLSGIGIFTPTCGTTDIPTSQ